MFILFITCMLSADKAAINNFIWHFKQSPHSVLLKTSGGLKMALPTLLFCIIVGEAMSQSQPIDYRQQFNMPTVVPASPDAASIEKFGNIPVSYATGVPDISIPLYIIKCGTLEWPVSLSYHAGGIRVDEIASNVGLGWSLNAPGVISRSRAGRPDEESTAEPVYTSVGPNNYQYLYNVLKGFEDSEQDVFNFSFNGRSGKFVVNQDGSIFQVPLSNLKITYTTGFNSFTITDENGVAYLFDQKEMTSSQCYPSESIATYYTSSWYLSKVELPDKNNTIQFVYSSAGQSNQSFSTFSQAVGRKYYDGSGGAFLGEVDQRSSSTMVMSVGMLKLISIGFPNGSIGFTYDASARLDLGSSVTNKLAAVTINNFVNNILTQIKKFSLHQSYFFYNPKNSYAADPKLYRLRLDSLAEWGTVSTTSPKLYRFNYNSTPMAPRENYGQDVWGYNNGQYNNPSLLQSETAAFDNGSQTLTYQIGDANRSVDTTQMQACMLTSINYPTGGITTFTFEPHVYNTDLTLTSRSEHSAQTSGDQAAPQVGTTTFTLPSTADTNSARVIVDMSMYNFSGVTQPSWVSVKDITTGALFYVESQTNAYQRVAWNTHISLVHGHTYELKAYVYSTVSNFQLTASIKVQWNNFTSAPDIRIGGGLRIKEIKNYSASGVLAGMERYIYDTAVTLTPFSHIQRTYSDVFYRLGSTGDGSTRVCTFYDSPLCRIYSSSPVYAISTAMGSPMMYRRVQKFIVDSASGASAGKSEYRYDVFRDENFAAGGRYTLVPFISNDWQNGSLVFEAHYKVANGIYTPVKTIENSYTQYNTVQTYSLRVQDNFIHEGCRPNQNVLTISTDAYYYTFPIRSGSNRLWKKVETLYDESQNKIETKTYSDYRNAKYDFPTKITVIDSKGNSDSVTFKRPPDFASIGNVYEKMEQHNILAPVVEQKSFSNAVLLSTVKNNYRDWSGDGKVIALDSIQAATFANTLETRLRYYSYDTCAHPLSVSKEKDVKHSYLWDYNNQYPIADVTGADPTNLAYTSFEADGSGNWSGLNTANMVMLGALSGKKYYSASNFSFIKSGLSTISTYTVSYWSKNGSFNVNSTSPLIGRTYNGWTLYEHSVANPVNGTITVSGTGAIDELRLYPQGAQMQTYSYEPLIGIATACDANNRIIYYEYDVFNRLSLIRDQNGNILKKVSYNYAGQPDQGL